MTQTNTPDLDAAGPPPPGWGPGKNAALSVLAFVVIFGMFAYLKGDARSDQVSHPLSNLRGTSQSTAGGSGAYAFVTPAESNIAHLAAANPPAPLPPSMSPVTVEVDPEAAQPAPTPTAPLASVTPPLPAAPAVPTPAEPALAPQLHTHLASRGEPRHAAHAVHVSPPVMAHTRHMETMRLANTHAPQPHVPQLQPQLHRASDHPTYAQALHELTTRGPAHAQAITAPAAPAVLASREHPYGTYTRYTGDDQPTRARHADQDGTQALATARACAVMDQWQCVEKNASRSLAVDPQNTESQSLLQQAIRNRI